MRVGFGSGQSWETDAVPSRKNRPDTGVTVHLSADPHQTRTHHDLDCDETNPLCYHRSSEAKGTDSLRLRLPHAMIQPDKARDEKKKRKKEKENTVAEAGRPMPNYLMDFLGELMK